MMEPTDVAIGLVGLYSVCIECFQQVQYGQRFGEHYESAKLKLDISQLRLQRWALSVGLIGDDIELLSFLLKHVSIQKINVARALLGSIIDAFENVERLSKRYEQNQRVIHVDAKDDNEAGLAVIDSDNLEDPSGLSVGFKKLHLGIMNRMDSRQQGNGNMSKARWVLYERKRFDDLIRDIKEYVDVLVDNFRISVANQEIIAAEEVKEITDNAEDRLLLKEISEKTDPILRQAVEHAITLQDRHHYSNIRLSGNSRVFLGNDIAYGASAMGSTYTNLVIDGNAIVHAGNVYRGRGQQQVDFGRETSRMIADFNTTQGLVRRGW